MRSSKTIHVVSCHAEGEVGDVIVGGVAPPPGKTLWEQSRFIANDKTLRNFMLNEPRGGVFRHINLLVPAKHPEAQMGWIIMEPEDTPPMSVSNSMCVSTVLLETGILPMKEPVTHLSLEAPGGVVRVTAKCHNGKVERLFVQNVPSFVDKLDAVLEVEGIGTLIVDTAFGGDSFVMADAKKLGFEIASHEAKDLAEIGIRITNAANEQLGFHHPENKDWRHISFCQIFSPPETENDQITIKNTVVIQPGKLDRSPTGTGVSARLAVMHARDQIKEGEELTIRSIINSTFKGKILRSTMLGDKPAIIPEISGRAWITGTHQHLLDPEDPWPQGYRISDTWPILSTS